MTLSLRVGMNIRIGVFILEELLNLHCCKALELEDFA